MCERVGVALPPEEAALDLVRRATDYVTRRVRSAFPGTVEAIRTLHARGYQLHTASGETSIELHNYLEGMRVRNCFGRLYGVDLVNCLKEGAEFYARMFAEVGTEPANALVIDDSPAAVHRASQAGAKTVLVGSTNGTCAPDLSIGTLAELPRIVGSLEA